MGTCGIQRDPVGKNVHASLPSQNFFSNKYEHTELGSAPPCMYVYTEWVYIPSHQLENLNK